MLDLWVLNVGHGDSIVLRSQTDDGYAYGVVDSNASKGEEPAALKKLRALNAERLSFVMLTHPHADHYRGMRQILNAYRGKISTFFSFPISGFLRVSARKAKFKELIERLVRGSDGEFREAQLELAEILLFAKSENDNGNLRWEEPVGRWAGLFPDGCHSATWEALLPLPRSKGKFFQLLDLADPAALTADAPNSMSIVLRATVGNSSVLLGADSTFESWYAHRHEMDRYAQRPDAIVVKIPHHGSKHDVVPQLIPYWYRSHDRDLRRYAIISADGRRHPNPAVLSLLAEAQIHPYCTNLAKPCGGRRVEQMFTAPEVSREVAQIINSGDIELRPEHIQVCQGEIHVNVSAQGHVTVTPQFRHPCGYRGDYARLVGELSAQ